MWVKPYRVPTVTLVETSLSGVRSLISSLPRWADIPASRFGAEAEAAQQSESDTLIQACPVWVCGFGPWLHFLLLDVFSPHLPA